MLALSLWQPWASALFATHTRLGDAVRLKANETRSWRTDYRGPLLICAAHRWDAELRDDPAHDLTLDWANPFGAAATAADSSLQWAYAYADWLLPLGAAIGLVDVVDCVPTESQYGQMAQWEWAMGNYDPGRYALVTANPRPLPRPLPIRARQKLFRPDEAMRVAVLAQLEGDPS